MPLVAPLQDGKFVNNASSTSLKNANDETNKSNMDSNAFLTLLVAEMQNQDPLEPTSNTEWVSQYATFTQVSEIQNIGNSMQSMKAQDLVGEYVIMKVTNAENGESDYVSGQVDYAVYEEGKAFLSIDGKLYSADDLDTVASKEYMEAYNLAQEITADYKKLPAIDALTSSYKKLVNGLYDKVDGMTAYQKKFVDEKFIDEINAYKTRLDMILKAEEAVKEATKNANTNTSSDAENQTQIVNNTTNVTNIYNNQSETDEKKTDKTAEDDKKDSITDVNTENSNVTDNTESSENISEESSEEAAENTAENTAENNNEASSESSEELSENAAENGAI